MSIVLFPIYWFLDYFRIKDGIQREGGRLIKMEWRPWDWNGNWDEGTRIYFVIYVDSLGNERRRECKTAMGRGNVYWLDQRDNF
jgi:hypothetical protein